MPFTAVDITEKLNEFVDLYQQVYAEPPYEETPDDAIAFSHRLTSEAHRPGFALVAAVENDTIIGFAHGYTFEPEQWWKAADTTPDEVHGLSKFAVMELVVRKDHRGQGVASELMRALLTDRAEPYATLCTNPAAPARAIYRAWGWRQVARTPQRPTFPGMDVLVLPL
jgi:GNAT superfamily N-acetyltransferase